MTSTHQTDNQAKIAIVTDSACDLDLQTLKDYGLDMLPLHVIYQDREYRDRVDITPQEVYDQIEAEVPKTSLPSLAEIHDLFARLKAENYTHVLAIHISSGLSGTYEAVASVAKEYKDMVIDVIDSKTLSMGLGFAVLEAAKARARAFTFEQIQDTARRVLEKVKVYYVLSTLEYLRKGGRIGLVAGTVGEFLNLKPIISVNKEGKYFTAAKVRGRDQSLKKLTEILRDHANEVPSNVAVVHGGAEREAHALENYSKQHANIKEVFFGQISPALGVHTGPGLVGFIIYPQNF